MESLENICKKKLQIPTISVIEIVDFLKKNKIYNSETIFLINFKNIRVKKFENLTDGKYIILGFKKIHKDNTFHIYCKKLDFSGNFLEYVKCYANEEITKKLKYVRYKKLDLNFGEIIDKDSPKYYFSITKELEKKKLKIYKSLLFEKNLITKK